MFTRKRHIASIISAVIAASISISQIPANSAADTTPTRVLVNAPRAVSDSDRAAIAKSQHGILRARVSDNQFAVEVPKNKLEDFKHAVGSKIRGTTIQVDVPSKIETLPNDPCLVTCAGSSQWGINAINAPQAWTKTEGSASVVVGVVDSGVSANIAELSGRVTKQIDEIPGQPANYDHGTEVASIVAANTNNDLGIAGVSWHSKILSVRVVDQTGIGWASDLAAGIRAAVDNGATVINVSMTVAGDIQVLHDAVNYANTKNVLIVAAAGNNFSNTPLYPAAYPGVLSVSGINNSYNNPGFAYGNWVQVYAPGYNDVAINQWGQPVAVSGTSFASPHAAGVAALIKSLYPTATTEGIRAMIDTTARTATDHSTNAPIHILDANAALSSKGYWMAATDGTVRNEGSASDYGSVRVAKPVVGMSATPDNKGYWTVASDGGIFSFGDAKFYGSTGAIRLNKPIVGMASTLSGRGYWLVASDGGIFAFGDARFFGSTGAFTLNKPIVGMSVTPTGNGYWLVASDGGIFAFGDAKFYGSTGAFKLNKPIAGMASTLSGRGYWLVASDGGIFAFGDAKFYGSTGTHPPSSPIMAIAPSTSGAGYWMISATGLVFAFGDAKFWGQGSITGKLYVGIAPSY